MERSVNKLLIRVFLALLIVSPVKIYSQTDCPPIDNFGKAIFPVAEESMRERFPEIRHSLPTLSEYTDREITMIMRSMGNNYYWRHEKPKAPTNVGVLILAHGVNGPGDHLLYESMKSLGQQYSTSIAYGMSMMTSSHISCALQEIQQEGIEKIYVVPLSESPYNTLIRQWRYAFDLEENYSYADIAQIKSDNVKFLAPINDHHYAREIVYDYAMQISTNPAEETVILVAHGPIDPSDNSKQLRLMTNILEHVQRKGRFYDVIPFSLQDDASPEVRADNVKRLRETIEVNTVNNRRVLIVTNLMSSDVIQAKVERDLTGLTYIFNSNGLVEHPFFVDWISEAINNQETQDD
jgi:hypothetical protein